jgi:hypothetical protein
MPELARASQFAFIPLSLAGKVDDIYSFIAMNWVPGDEVS